MAVFNLSVGRVGTLLENSASIFDHDMAYLSATITRDKNILVSLSLGDAAKQLAADALQTTGKLSGV